MDKPNDSAPTNAPSPPEHQPTRAEWKAFSDSLLNAILEPESVARLEAVVEENKRRQDQGRTDWVGLDPDEELLLKGVPPRKEMMRRLREFMRARGEQGVPTMEEYEALVRRDYEGPWGERSADQGGSSATAREDSSGGLVDAAQKDRKTKGSSTFDGS